MQTLPPAVFVVSYASVPDVHEYVAVYEPASIGYPGGVGGYLHVAQNPADDGLPRAGILSLIHVPGPAPAQIASRAADCEARTVLPVRQTTAAGVEPPDAVAGMVSA